MGLIFSCKAKEAEITKAPSKETEQVQAKASSATTDTAGSPLSPEVLPGVKMVDSEWVKANYQKMTVIDPRFKAEYVEEHIPGAISAEYIENSKKSIDFDSSKDTMDMSKLSADKNTPIIVIGNDKH